MLRILTQTIILQIALKLQGIINLQRRGREGDPQQNKRVRTWEGSDVFVFNEVFRILVKVCPL